MSINAIGLRALHELHAAVRDAGGNPPVVPDAHERDGDQWLHRLVARRLTAFGNLPPAAESHVYGQARRLLFDLPHQGIPVANSLYNQEAPYVVDRLAARRSVTACHSTIAEHLHRTTTGDVGWLAADLARLVDLWPAFADRYATAAGRRAAEVLATALAGSTGTTGAALSPQEACRVDLVSV